MHQYHSVLIIYFMVRQEMSYLTRNLFMHFPTIIAWTCVLYFKLIMKADIRYSPVLKKIAKKEEEVRETFRFFSIHKHDYQYFGGIFLFFSDIFRYFSCSWFYYLPPSIIKKRNEILE